MTAIWKVAQEHRFWLEILEDHAHFLHDHFASHEKNGIGAAARFIERFQRLREKTEGLEPELAVQSPQWISFAKESYPVAAAYYKFEGQQQALRVENKIDLNLTPFYLNSTISENQEYLRMLGYYVQGVDAPALSLWSLMDLWLEDQLGHAILFCSTLDSVETMLAEEAAVYASVLQGQLMKNRAIRGYLRFLQPGFAVQRQFARDVSETTAAFCHLVEKAIVQLRENELLPQATPRFLEHHILETCYFLGKLSLNTPDSRKLEPCPLPKPTQ